jgi:hypothetical protein
MILLELFPKPRNNLARTDKVEVKVKAENIIRRISSPSSYYASKNASLRWEKQVFLLRPPGFGW